MATAKIKIPLAGLQSQSGLTAKLFAHPGTQNASAAATISTITADTASVSTYWCTVDATSLSGVYEVKVFYSNGDDAGFGYVYLTNTTDVHIVQDSPAVASAVGSLVSSVTANVIADHVLRRNQSNAEASSNGDSLAVGSLYGFVQQAQESSISANTLTIKKTDGSTTLGTKALTVSATADAVTGIS